jgi:CheY-like chemotaxis protein
MPPILIVDDDAAIRDSLQTLLQEHHLAAITCATGPQALDVLRTASQPFIVLLDIRMPEMSGWQVLAAVAADPASYQRHAYLLMTAMTAVAIVPEQMALITQTHAVILAKPFDFQVLLAEIAEAEHRIRVAATQPTP